jgi:hypothetical protein
MTACQRWFREVINTSPGPLGMRSRISSVANDIYCYSNPSAQACTPWPYGTGFDVRCALFHSFWKPYSITLDFTGMNLYIAPGKAG